MADKVPAPVFGPARSRAAIAAIAELAAASEAKDKLCRGWSDYDTPAVRERYRIARANREQYAEYGDSFRGH